MTRFCVQATFLVCEPNLLKHPMRHAWPDSHLYWFPAYLGSNKSALRFNLQNTRPICHFPISRAVRAFRVVRANHGLLVGATTLHTTGVTAAHRRLDAANAAAGDRKTWH